MRRPWNQVPRAFGFQERPEFLPERSELDIYDFVYWCCFTLFVGLVVGFFIGFVLGAVLT